MKASKSYRTLRIDSTFLGEILSEALSEAMPQMHAAWLRSSKPQTPQVVTKNFREGLMCTDEAREISSTVVLI